MFTHNWTLEKARVVAVVVLYLQCKWLFFFLDSATDSVAADVEVDKGLIAFDGDS